MQSTKLWLGAILLAWLNFSTACSSAPETKILPANRTTPFAVVCPPDYHCDVDMTRVTVDGGYLREILVELDRCGNK